MSLLQYTSVICTDAIRSKEVLLTNINIADACAEL